MSVSTQQRIQILHVDDEPGFADLATTFLEDEDDRFTTETATSADEGLKILADQLPDCVVSDYNMPGMDGLEFLQAVRKEYPDLPFILFTGKGSEAIASEAFAAGVTDYLQKGSGSERYELLANRIRNAVQARNETERADRQEELMRLTEFAGDTGGFELNVDSGTLLLTDGTCRLLGLPDGTTITLEEWIEFYHPDDQADVRQTINQAAEADEQTRGTWCLQTLDGDERLVDVTITSATESGEVTTLQGAIHDVTERREREQELRRTYDLMANIEELANVGSYEYDPETGEMSATAGFYPILEIDPDASMKLDEAFEFIAPEDRDRVRDRFEACLETGEPYEMDVRAVTADGEKKWVTTRGELTDTNENGPVLRGYVQDITEQKDYELELQAEREFTTQALNTLDDIFYVIDTDGIIQWWNEEAVEVTGYDPANLDGLAAIELFPEDEHQTIADAIETTLREGEITVEADLLTADGERVPYEFTGARLTDADGQTTNLVGVGRDLTERRRRERRFQALVEESNDIISILDADGVFEYQSPSIKRILGYGPEETVGDTAWEYIHPDDRESVMGTFEEWVTNPDTTAIIEYRAQHANGSYRWIEARGNNQLDNPAVEGYVVNSRDVTDRKQRTEILQTLHDTTQSFIEAPDTQTVADHAVETARSVLNQPLNTIWFHDESENVLRPVAATKEARSLFDNLPTYTGGGSLSWKAFETGDIHVYDDLQDTPGRYNSETLIKSEIILPLGEYGVMNLGATEPRAFDEFDVSLARLLGNMVKSALARADREQNLRRQREQVERQNERLEEFTSVVSHDLRNPLGAAKGRLELMREECESDHIDDVVQALGRMEALIEDLLTLAREGDQVGETEPVMLADLVEDCWQNIAAPTAEVVTDCDRTVQADRSRLQQLLENLLRNAIEHGGADVTVTIGEVEAFSDEKGMKDDGANRFIFGYRVDELVRSE